MSVKSKLSPEPAAKLPSLKTFPHLWKDATGNVWLRTHNDDNRLRHSPHKNDICVFVGPDYVHTGGFTVGQRYSSVGPLDRDLRNHYLADGASVSLSNRQE